MSIENIFINNIELTPKSHKTHSPIAIGPDFEEFIDFQRVPLEGSGVKELKINELGLFGVDSILHVQ